MLATQQVTSADQFPATVPPTTQAFRLGALSAQLGEVCCPEVVFLRRNDIKQFCLGYRSIVGNTITTVQILGEVQQ